MGNNRPTLRLLLKQQKQSMMTNMLTIMSISITMMTMVALVSSSSVTTYSGAVKPSYDVPSPFFTKKVSTLDTLPLPPHDPCDTFTSPTGYRQEWLDGCDSLGLQCQNGGKFNSVRNIKR
jgi:hypothetical protein